jgi:DNA topoisomerase-3
MAYVCEKSLGAEKSCDFRSGRIILQRPIEREQMQKLLASGRTDLLHRFISKKGRPFSAFLVRGGDGKVGFEFAPRAAKPRKAGVKPAKAGAGAIKPAAVAKISAKKTGAKTAAGTGTKALKARKSASA